MSTSRTARFTLAAVTAAIAFVAMLSCTSNNNQPPDPANPGQGGGGGFPALPDIQQVTPDETCATAGNILTIVGENLIGEDVITTVRINGVTADVLSRESIGDVDVLTVQTRAQSSTFPASGLFVDVEVTNARGQDELAGAVRIFPACQGAPVLVALDPSTAPRVGGSPLTLRGNNLACLTDIRFVGTMGGPTLEVDISSVESDQTVLIESPITGVDTNEPFDLVVTSACGTTVLPGAFTFSGTSGGMVVPNATGIFDVNTGLPQGPATGGNTVRIVGSDLDEATTVDIGPITLLRNTDFVVTAAGDILILAMPASPGGASLTLPLSVVVGSAEGDDPTPLTYTYLGAGAANCLTLTPNSGPLTGGTEVTITGTNLNSVECVLFGGEDAGTVFFPDANGERIVVLSPTYIAPIDVDIELGLLNDLGECTPVENCNPATFTFVDDSADPPFSLTGINPMSGPQTGGTTIIITGTGLIDANSVRVCNLPATILTVLDTQIRANTTAFVGNVPVTCDVTVSTALGESATLEDAFTYLPVVPDAVPPFAAGSATSAPACGGTTFRLNGTNFSGATDVRFSGTQGSSGSAVACDVQIQGNTQISGTVPSYITPGGPFPATVNVIVESDAGGDPTPLTFTYYANPTIQTVRGPLGTDAIALGETVTITGTNFRPENDNFVAEVEVSNSGTAAGTAPGQVSGLVSFQIVDNNTIQFQFPFSLADEYDVTIRTPNLDRSCVGTVGGCEFTQLQTLIVGSAAVARVQPDTGRFSGGTTVLITGNFPFPPTGVTICGTPATITTGSATTSQVLVTAPGVPENLAGTPCDIVVTTPAGDDTITGAFTYVANPDPTNIEVDTVGCATLVYPMDAPIPVRQGQVIRIIGTDLSGVTSVQIGSASAIINGATRTDTLLEVTVPASPGGTGPLDVTTTVTFAAAPGGTADLPFTDVLPSAVQYQTAPTITAIAPNPAAAGDTVTITGTQLLNSDGSAPFVFFGATPAAVDVSASTATSLVVTVPAGTAGSTVLVSVQTCQGAASRSFTYECNLPTIANLSITMGSAGDTLTITGADLVDPDGIPAFPTVTFGTANATVTAASAGSVTVLVPAGTLGSTVTVSVTTCGGTANAANQFTYACTPPTINSITPIAGTAGTVVTISGINLDSPNGVPPTVSFGATVVSPTTVSGTSITVTAPAGTGTVPVSVTNCGGTAISPTNFSYCAVPNATSVTPSSGSAGDTVTIGGTNLQSLTGSTTVAFAPVGGGASTPATVVSTTPTSVVVQAPSNLTGQQNVSVTTCGGTDLAGTFLFCVAPTVNTTANGVTPTTGAAGNSITILGSNFIGLNGQPATVTIGGIAAPVTLVTNGQLVVTVPVNPGAPGQFPIVVTTCGGSATAVQLFSYCATPAITSLTPTNGPGGTEVVIAGTNLIGADGGDPTVRFQNVEVTVIDATPTQITVEAPTSPFMPGQAVNVRVDTCGGTSPTGPQTVFTYAVSTTCVAPTVGTVSPSVGPATGGNTVVITGTNLIGNDGNPGVVTFGANPATFITGTGTQLVVTAPAGTGIVGVTVTTCGGAASSATPYTYCAVPTTTSITPATAAVGSIVTITGTNLVGANGSDAEVFFGVEPGDVVDATPTQILVEVPSGVAPGTTVNVRARTCGGDSNAQTFTFAGTMACTAPSVTSIAPTSGPAGTTLLISGANLVGADMLATTVMVGANPATVLLQSASQLQVTVPAGAGTVAVQVTTCGGTTSAPQLYTYCAVPTTTMIAPAMGPAGTTVVITGTNLVSADGTPTEVRFGLTNATVVDATATSVTVTAPAGFANGTAVGVRVETCGGTSNAQTFTYQGVTTCTPPSVTSMTPTFGPAGTTVTITGSNLVGADLAPTVVAFGGNPATVVSSNPTQLVVTVPAGTGSVAVEVQTCGGTTNAPTLFTYCTTPTTTMIAPNTGAAGTTVVITGTDLVGPTGTTQVTFGLTNAVIVDQTPTTITVTAPAGFANGTAVNVRVTTCGGQSNAQTFTFGGATTCTAPTVTSITPTAGPAGTTLTVSGTNLIGADGNPGVVEVGGTVAPAISSTASQLVVTVPAGTGTDPVEVTTCGGNAFAPQLFTYCLAPTTTMISPNTGTAGQQVTITGTNLEGADGQATDVFFGFTPAVVIDSTPTTLLVTVPAGFNPGTAVNVRAVTCGGTSNSQTFTYGGTVPCTAPVVSTITPTEGPTGTVVTITGTNLVGADGNPSVVEFGGTPATIVTASPGQLVVNAPAGMGTVPVEVTTCGGTAAAPQLFTYCAAPTITGIAPTSGGTGTIVTITGTNLQGADGGAPDVTFGTQPANVIDFTATTITVQAPAGTTGTTVTVRATTCGGTATSPMSYTYVVTPTCTVLPVITSVNPAVGQSGTVVEINGTDLVGGDGNPPQVFFDGTTANLISSAPNQLLVIAPAGFADGTMVDVRVVTCAGFDTEVDGFQYQSSVACAAPTITMVNPATGSAGNAVTITGTNLVGADGADTTVLFDTTQALVLNQSSTSLLVQAPAGFMAGTLVDITVITCGGAVTDTDAFQYEAVSAFDVQAIAPSAGPRSGGQTVVITGTGLGAVTDIEICDVNVTSFTIVNSTRIEAVTAPFDGPAPVTCDVEVSDAMNSDTLVDGYTYQPLVPDATMFGASSAQTAPAAGGTFLQLTGTNMLDVDEIQFGGNVGDPTACNVQAVSDTSAIGIVPALETGFTVAPIDVDIFVASDAGRDNTPVMGFTYYPNPTASTVVGSCGVGCANVGTTATLIGDEFRPESWDHVGSVTLTPSDPMSMANPVSVGFVIIDNNTIDFGVPAGISPETYDITITTTGSGATCANDYSFTLGSALLVLP